jgi:hypothetical protein
MRLGRARQRRGWESKVQRTGDLEAGAGEEDLLMLGEGEEGVVEADHLTLVAVEEGVGRWTLEGEAVEGEEVYRRSQEEVR